MIIDCAHCQDGADQVPLPAERRQRDRNLFEARGIDRFDTQADQDACMEALADESVPGTPMPCARVRTRPSPGICSRAAPSAGPGRNQVALPSLYRIRLACTVSNGPADATVLER